ncbi:MAG: hypothetical protein EOO01_42035 [Chitinophagaceae bacterium]|nr:MAG: hypothetical protein EOO01_42035 [Chitinophagaceae bacterium]
MKNAEGEWTAVGTGAAANNEQLKNQFERLLATLETSARNENFHLLEHILLRPKIDPQPETKAEQGIPTSSVLLLDLNNIPSDLQTSAPTQPAFPYRFKNTHTTKKNSTELYWQLSLVKDKNTDILITDELFQLKREVNERMHRLKESGADRGNYKEGKNADGYFTFSIQEKDRTLASSKKAYRKKEEMDKEIDTLVAFFAFELNLIATTDDTDESSFTDTIDPYSFQVSFFLPDWPERFRDPGFRHLLETTIQAEVPAHIFPTIFWLDYKTMKDFEKVYKPWLEEIALNPIPDTGILNNLVFVLNQIMKMN